MVLPVKLWRRWAYQSTRYGPIYITKWSQNLRWTQARWVMSVQSSTVGEISVQIYFLLARKWSLRPFPLEYLGIGVKPLSRRWDLVSWLPETDTSSLSYGSWRQACDRILSSFYRVKRSKMASVGPVWGSFKSRSSSYRHLIRATKLAGPISYSRASRASCWCAILRREMQKRPFSS